MKLDLGFNYIYRFFRNVYGSRIPSRVDNGENYFFAYRRKAFAFKKSCHHIGGHGNVTSNITLIKKITNISVKKNSSGI